MQTRQLHLHKYTLSINFYYICCTKNVTFSASTSLVEWQEVHSSCKNVLQLDGCMVWSAHNTVFGSKCSAICAQAVYFLHSMRPSVTWLEEGELVRLWLAACDWVMSALSAVLSTCVRCRRKFEVTCRECTVRSVETNGMTLNWFQQ